MVYDKFQAFNFDTQEISLPDPKVIIEFNGSGLHKIVGPTPLISLSSAYNRSDVGQLDSIDRKIQLIGKIVRSPNRNFVQDVTPDTTGIKGLVGAHEELKRLFSECSAGTLSIFCDGEAFFKQNNVRVDSIDLSSEDNFVQVADYTIDLSFTEPGTHGFSVKNTSDDWSIEPLEDYVYINYSQNIDGKPELHSPLTNSTVPIDRNFAKENNKIDLIDVPRYKISRKLSAVGLPPTGISGCTDGGFNTSFQEAKRWVQSKLPTAFDNENNSSNTLNSGVPAFSSNGNYASLGLDVDTYLYNHVRTINYSVSAGSYSVAESWLAMPTAIRYIEDYDIDVSTDENYVKSVTVKGEVRGLQLKQFTAMSGSGLPPNNENLINIDYDQMENASLGSAAVNVLGSDKATVQKNRYENALSGFLYDVKPSIYSRASMGLNNGYYQEEFLDNNTVAELFGVVPIEIDTSNAPQIRNPTYVKEAQLNIIPISTSEAHNTRKGSLSYTYQFNNKPNFITGVISSNIAVDTTFPNDVFAESFVLGRTLGPVLQDLGTITSAKKNITIEVNVIPPKHMNGLLMSSPDCPLYHGGYVYQTITGIIEGLKPYGDQQSAYFNPARINDAGKVFVVNNQENWNPTQGKYTLSLGYVYQPCNASRDFRNT